MPIENYQYLIKKIRVNTVYLSCQYCVFIVPTSISIINNCNSNNLKIEGCQAVIT